MVKPIIIIWRTHQPGLYLMKYFSILPPDDMPNGIDNRYPGQMDNPPAGPQKPYLL
jgi:hypothetical protein